MGEISRVALFGKLNSLPTKRSKARPSSASCAAIRTSSWCIGCTRSCRRRTPTCTASCGISSSTPSRLAQDLTEALDRLPRGATSISDLSAHVEDAVERGWVYGIADVRRVAGAHRPSGGRHAEDAVACAMRSSTISREFEKIKVDDADR